MGAPRGDQGLGREVADEESVTDAQVTELPDGGELRTAFRGQFPHVDAGDQFRFVVEVAVTDPVETMEGLRHRRPTGLRNVHDAQRVRGPDHPAPAGLLIGDGMGLHGHRRRTVARPSLDFVGHPDPICSRRAATWLNNHGDHPGPAGGWTGLVDRGPGSRGVASGHHRGRHRGGHGGQLLGPGPLHLALRARRPGPRPEDPGGPAGRGPRPTRSPGCRSGRRRSRPRSMAADRARASGPPPENPWTAGLRTVPKTKGISRAWHEPR